MAMTVKGEGSVFSTGSSISNGTLTIKNTNNSAARMQNIRKNTNNTKPKKKLNYNSREISSQLVRAAKSRTASVVLIRAKSRVSVLQSALASGQYNESEVRIAIAHAQRMVRCSRMKVNHLKEEEQMKGRHDKEYGSEEQKKKNEVRRRVRQKEQALKTKIAVEENQRMVKEKMKRQELQRKRRLHRNEELGKINEADMKYLEDQIRQSQNEKTEKYNGVTLDLSQTAGQMRELQMTEQQLEQQVEAEVEMELDNMDIGAAIDVGIGDGGAMPSSADAGGAEMPSVDISI